MTSKAERRRHKRQNRQAPSLPRAIGANDNVATANDNEPDIEIQGVVLNKEQARRFRAASAQQESADRMIQGAGRNAMVQLQAEIDAVLAGRKVKADIAETVGLEELRGALFETSTRKESEGRKRNLSRDGLETLLTAHAISTVQHAAGLRYRDDYEAIDPEKGLTPPSIDQTRKIVRGGDGYAAKRREIEERVFGIHCMIAGVEPPRDGKRAALPTLPAGHPSMRSIYALNRIAGRGDNLGDMTTSGSVKARLREDLIHALDACAVVYGLE